MLLASRARNVDWADCGRPGTGAACRELSRILSTLWLGLRLLAIHFFLAEEARTSVSVCMIWRRRRPTVARSEAVFVSESCYQKYQSSQPYCSIHPERSIADFMPYFPAGFYWTCFFFEIELLPDTQTVALTMWVRIINRRANTIHVLYTRGVPHASCLCNCWEYWLVSSKALDKKSTPKPFARPGIAATLTARGKPSMCVL